MDLYDSPATCFISARTQHQIRTVAIRDDILVLIRQGTKTLIDQGHSRTVGAGMAAVLAHGSQWDVINVPGSNGRYEALVLQFGDRAVEDFERLYGTQYATERVEGSFIASPDRELADTVARTAESIADPEASQQLRHHRVLEILLLLAETGCLLRPRQELNWPDRLRRMISHRPHGEWTIDSLALACATSASTLRRRLAEHDLTVAGLVREIRLETAMLLLQTTALPVGEIAQRCGYESHSRFSVAFKARYGFVPSHLR
ncbi:MAG TPA: helix-turn-helix transcriptional regulator [Rhodocyclaceae bacterium]|nr:helix-turn-helix transcriptional regulator [Rhodocyclaceae bacterium]